MWNLPWDAHRSFIGPLGGIHAQTLIYMRYIGFMQSIRRSRKMAVMYLLEKVIQDMTTMTGQNARHIADIAEEVDIFRIKKEEFKRNFRFQVMPEDET